MSAPAASGCATWADLADIPADSAELHAPQAWCGYLELATDVLWAATGRRWRGVELVENAVLRAAPPRAGEDSWSYDRSWGHCPCRIGTVGNTPIWGAGQYAHAAPLSVRIPRRDVTTIISVTLDGAPFAAWRLDGVWLTRTDGQPWPVCHERTVVTYRYGRLPPRAGVVACVELALEVGKSAAGKPCALPKRLQSVTRQGITFAALDSLEFLDKGLTGLPTVDLWIRSVNPRGRAQEAQVWSPDLATARRVR